MRRFGVGVVMILAVAAFGLSMKAQVQPSPLIDRVGFPEGYESSYVPLFAFDRPDARQVRVVYGNHTAANIRFGQSYPYGSVLVMETYSARLDAAGVPLRDGNGRYQRNQLTGIFVMRKERGFGEEYERNRTGEWEYVAYRGDRTYLTAPRDSWSCANCHLMATAGKDWVFRTNLITEGGASTGAVPDGVLQHYAFVPAAIRVRAGSFVNWLNDDEVEHRLALVGPPAAEGPLMVPGGSFRARFNTVGEFDVVCRIHPQMRARVTVDP